MHRASRFAQAHVAPARCLYLPLRPATAIPIDGIDSHNKGGWGGGGSHGGEKIRSGVPGSGLARGEGKGVGGGGGIEGPGGARKVSAQGQQSCWKGQGAGRLFKNTSPAICRLASKKDDLKLPWQSYAQKAPPW